MANSQFSPDIPRLARLAGLLYLVIIICGLGAELGLRGPLIDFEDAAGTAASILAAPGHFRLAIAADLLMAICDAGLAIVLFLVFRAISFELALAALVFRLIQSVLIATSLLALIAAWIVIESGTSLSEGPALALTYLNLHAHGYDLGLVFFGINSLLMGMLVWRSGFVAKTFGVALAVAGSVYIVGSSLRFFAPGLSEAFMPAYGLTFLAESAFCLRLLLQQRTA